MGFLTSYVYILAGDVEKRMGEYQSEHQSGIPGGCILFKRTTEHNTVDKLLLSQFKRVEKATEASVSTYGGALGWGAAGALVLGPVGLVAGLLFGSGSETEITFVAELKDGRKLMARSDSDFYSDLLAAVFSGQNDSNSSSYSEKNPVPPVKQVEKTYNLKIDDQNRVSCPVCNKGVVVSKNMVRFKCPTCKTEIRFKDESKATGCGLFITIVCALFLVYWLMS